MHELDLGPKKCCLVGPPVHLLKIDDLAENVLQLHLFAYQL